MAAADESICPRPTPCRADDGYAWCRLCHDSPIDRIASGQLFVLLSLVWNGRRPKMWHTEFTLHVTWCSNTMRARPAHSRHVKAPTSVPDRIQPSPSGRVRLMTVRAGN